MTSPRLTAPATALLAALGLAACSDGGGGATTATPGERHHLGGDQCGDGAGFADRRVPDRGRRPADAGRGRHGLPRRDLGARASAGPGLRLPADGGDRPRRPAVEVDVPARRAEGQGRRGVELGRGRARDAARGLLGDQVDHQHPGRAWRRPTATSTSTTGPSATSRSGAARSPGRSRSATSSATSAAGSGTSAPTTATSPRPRTARSSRSTSTSCTRRARCGPTTTRPSRPSTGWSRRRPVRRPARTPPSGCSVRSA